MSRSLIVTGIIVLVATAVSVLTISHPGLAPIRVSLPADRSGRLQDVVLDPGRELAVSARTREGEPMGVIIHAKSTDGPPELVWPIRLSKQGEGVLGRIPTGAIRLEIIAPGMERFYVSVGATQERLDLVFDPVPGAPVR